MLVCFGRYTANKRMHLDGGHHVCVFCRYNTNNVFDSLYKLDFICRKVTQKSDLTWVFNGLHDAWRNHYLSDSGLSVRSIQGKGGARSIVEMLLHKKKILGTLIHEQMPTHLPDTVKMTMRQVCADHDVFRSHCGSPRHPARPSLAWRAGWPDAAVSYLDFIEESHHPP